MMDVLLPFAAAVSLVASGLAIVLVLWRPDRRASSDILSLRCELGEIRRRVDHSQLDVDTELARFLDHYRLELHTLGARLSELQRYWDGQFDSLADETDDLFRQIEQANLKKTVQTLGAQVSQLAAALDKRQPEATQLQAVPAAGTEPPAAVQEPALPMVAVSGSTPLKDWIRPVPAAAAAAAPSTAAAEEPLPWLRLRSA